MIKQNLTHRFMTAIIRFGTAILCKLDKDELSKVPQEGPLIAYANHIGQLEVPLIFSYLQPRPVIAMAKAESWDNWFFNWLFDVWHLIPVRRGEADMDAMRRSIQMIKEGNIFGISPEGTRSGDGKLQKSHPGIVPIALKTGAPLIAVAHFGAEKYPENFKGMKRTDFHIRVGKPFLLDAGNERVTKEVRQEMVDEMMIELAKLLPEEYRGYYADKVDKELRYIRYE
jgi:1-acyl-sn-glycerol-3-phosphate acyltransferase